MINLLIPKMVFSVDVLGQLLLCLNYFQWGMGGVGWGGVGWGGGLTKNKICSRLWCLADV